MTRVAKGGVRLMEALSAAGLHELSTAGVRLAFARETIIFREGEQAQGLHILLSGRVKVYKTSPRGRTQTLLVAEPGDLVGEAALLLGGRYPATAVALEPTETLYLSRESLVTAVRENPEVALRLLGILARRLRALTELVADLALRDVSGRVANHILRLAAESNAAESVRLDLSKKELATALGTVPETLSRALTQLERAGAISARGRLIEIRDRVFLAQLAGEPPTEDSRC